MILWTTPRSSSQTGCVLPTGLRNFKSSPSSENPRLIDLGLLGLVLGKMLSSVGHLVSLSSMRDLGRLAAQLPSMLAAAARQIEMPILTRQSDLTDPHTGRHRLPLDLSRDVEG